MSSPVCSLSCAKTRELHAYSYIAYSVTSAFESNGVCVTTSGTPITLPTAYSEVLSSANDRVTLDANGQQAFIDFLGFSTCSGGGEKFNPTALIQVKNTTATQTSTFSNVPFAAIASLTIAPVSSGHGLRDSRTLFTLKLMGVTIAIHAVPASICGSRSDHWRPLDYHLS